MSTPSCKRNAGDGGRGLDGPLPRETAGRPAAPSFLLSEAEIDRIVDSLRAARGGAMPPASEVEAVLDWAYRAALEAEMLALVLARDVVVDVDPQGRIDFRRREIPSDSASA